MSMTWRQGLGKAIALDHPNDSGIRAEHVVRVAFWIIGSVSGGILAFTTRHFMGGDALPYIEMGEALVTGEWLRLVNFNLSPLYPVLLGLGQVILRTDPESEIVLLKIVNFFCFLLAMGAADLLIQRVGDLVRDWRDGETQPLPFAWLSAFGYAAFLVCALTLVRVRLMNPDMVVLAVTLALAALVLWIRKEPTSYSRYIVLGVVSGIGYLSKTFLFVFSPVFIVMAGLCAGSIKKAAPRTLVALLVMLAVCTPLVAALSWRAGRFTYGDTGGTVYALCVSAKGQPTRPFLLNERPEVRLYRWDISCTRPAGFDVCYWTAGLEPDFNFTVQWAMFLRNVWEIFEQVPWLGLLIAAYAICCALGLVRIGGLSPPSVCVLLGVPAVIGLGLFALLRIEARYLAPFIVMATLAMGASLMSVPGKPFARKVTIGCLGLLTGALAAILIHTVVDQSYRSLVPTEAKPSYRAIFEETVALGRWLRSSGLKPGDEVGSVGGFLFHAARMAGLKVTVEVLDREQFLESSRAERMRVVEVLVRAGIKAIVMEARNPGAWVHDGWQHVPGTRQSFVLLFDEAREGHSQRVPGLP